MLPTDKEAPPSSTRSGPLPPSPPQAYRPARPNRNRRSPPMPSAEIDVNPDEFMNRRSSAAEALGKFRRKKILGHVFYYSNDYWAWFVPSILTFFIVIGNMAVAWDIIGWWGFTAVVTLVSTGLTSSYLVTCTDPGIYPRLKPGEPDPLAGYEGLVFCRVCRLRRPPRTSHCYQCNVCVLEHDHHCGIIGGCVGIRSLRWFTLFLVCQSTACCIGAYWLGYFFVTTVYAMEHRSTTASVGLMPTELPSYLASWAKRRLLVSRNPRDRGVDNVDLVGLRHIGAVFMLLIDFLVIGLVGALAVMYVYLTATSTTRRESQSRESSCQICCHPKKVLANIRHTALPPGSLLEDDEGEPLAMVTVLVDGASENNRLL